MKCPVCTAEAENITEHAFDGRSVRCAKCGDYDVSGSVYEPGNLTKMAAGERLRALQKAKQFATCGKRQMITIDTL